MKISFAAFTLALAAASGCAAQTPGDKPAFDAASIHANTVQAKPVIQVSPGSLTMRNQSLLFLIQWAYDTPPFQIEGPDWLNQNRFDVVAKAEAGGDEARVRLMLRTLLAERFGLKTRSQQKEMQIYAVTLAKSGPKFQESKDEGPPVFDKGGPTMLTAHRVTMKDLAMQISDPLQRPVIDETGLKGRYDIKIDVSGYMLDQNGGGEKSGPPPDLMSLLFKGLQEQLGIKLESKKENVPILVIDHVEKVPTEN